MKQWTRANFQPSIPLGQDGRRATASPEHIRLSREAAREGMVLLKNEHHTLPLAMGTRIALFGKGTIDYVKGGGGSGDVTVPYVRNLYEGLRQLVDPASIFEDSIAFYREHVSAQYAMGRVPGMTAEPELPDALVNKARAFTDTAIISISRFSGENWDRRAGFDPIADHKNVDQMPVQLSREIFEQGDFYLSAAERAMLRKVTAAFPHVVVVLNTGGMVETAALAEDPAVSAVLLAWQGGMEGGLAAAELIMGLGNPCGKLCDTLARDLADYPFAESFFDSDDYAEYTEDIYVGYRYFETIPGAKDRVVYPFGYGLSYTSFSLSGHRIAVEDDGIIASVRVCNTGVRPGREVVQVYVQAPQGLLGKPARVLAGYRKTRLLAPGEEEMVIVRFPVSVFASYDDLGKVCASAWLLEKGEYIFHIGTSVRDTLAAPETFVLSEDRIVSRLSRRLAPVQLTRRMLADGSFESLPTAPCERPTTNTDFFESSPAVRAQPSIDRNEPKNLQLAQVASGEITLDSFIARLSDEDLAHLLGGQPNTGVANTFGVGNQPLYGIPNIMTADGPAGLRVHADTGICTTAFPCATLLACTWDPEIAYRVGAAGALEVKENNIGVWLTPGVCIHRNPLCGRNFEYYSEDPLLTGKQAAALIRGIQSQRVAATPKHFALNNKETNRRNSDSRASERAIREIYIRQFEIIVKESRPWCIMTSYNIINGVRASENADLLQHILRDEWGFDGMVTTDWWTYGDHDREVTAGNDLKMAAGHPDALLRSLAAGTLKRTAMEAAARSILTMILRVD
ncbi:MAG: glycoside hydrolase family 3 C-terminal domain-containing protein [Clostridia bacterium]|nr:glycoside hydrolase family 3 C-terminal domain-containing protein [Clostridia bacterium]